MAAVLEGVWVFADVRYRRVDPERFRAECPLLGVAVEAEAQVLARQSLMEEVARTLRPLLQDGTLPEHLAAHGFLADPQGHWLPRFSEGDERLYIRVSPHASLPVLGASSCAGTKAGDAGGTAAEDSAEEENSAGAEGAPDVRRAEGADETGGGEAKDGVQAPETSRGAAGAVDRAGKR